MSQPWLHNNRRLLLPLSIPALLLALIGVVCSLAGVWSWRPLMLIGLALVVIALTFKVAAWSYFRRPRLSYEPGTLLVHLGVGRTIAVPVEIVECFFMGQAPSMVRGPGGEEAETATVVVRLAEKAKEWHHREIPAYLGQWCDGYIIVRGTWCEPIDMDLLTRLNRLLAEAHRAQKQTAKAGA